VIKYSKVPEKESPPKGTFVRAIHTGFRPDSLVVDEKQIYVSGNSLLYCLSLDSNGKQEFQICRPSHFLYPASRRPQDWSPRALEIVDGNFYICNRTTMIVLNHYKNIRSEWQLPYGCLDISEGAYFKVDIQTSMIYLILNQNTPRVFVYNDAGEHFHTEKFKKGKKIGQFNRARGLTSDDEHLYICDQENHRIQVLEKFTFKPLLTWGTIDEKKQKKN